MKKKAFVDKKKAEIEPSQIKAFGVTLFSRYGEAREMEILINLLLHIRQAELMASSMIEEIFYDSKSWTISICIRVGAELAVIATEKIERAIQNYPNREAISIRSKNQ